MVLSFAGFAAADHLAAVIVCNAALALSSSVFAPVSKALLGDVLPEGTRVRWFSHQYLATNAGYAIGPFLGGLLLSTWNGTAMYLGIGALALAGAAVYLAAGRRITGRARRREGVHTTRDTTVD